MALKSRIAPRQPLIMTLSSDKPLHLPIVVPISVLLSTLTLRSPLTLHTISTALPTVRCESCFQSVCLYASHHPLPTNIQPSPVSAVSSTIQIPHQVGLPTMSTTNNGRRGSYLPGSDARSPRPRRRWSPSRHVAASLSL